MPLVIKPSALACRAERLARAGRGPDGTVVRPSGPAQREAPDADTGEEMALRIAEQLPRFDIFNTPLVYKTGGDVPCGY